MATKKQLQEDNDTLSMMISHLSGMLSRKDDERSKLLAKMKRKTYVEDITNFEVSLIEDEDGIMVKVGDKFELYKTINNSWTVRLVGIGMNQYEAFIDIVPVSVQLEAIRLLMEGSK